MIHVHVAASPAVVRAGLESVISSSGTLSLSIDELTADVVLASLNHLTDDGITTFSGYSVPVVLLAEVADAPLLYAALRSNIRAVLSPEASPEEIVAAVTGAAAGLVTLQPASLELLSHGL